MKTKIQAYTFLILIYAILNISCQKLDLVTVTKFVSTPPAININFTSATVKGELMDVGEGVTSYGHLCSIDPIPMPDIANFKTEINGVPPKQVEFTSELKGLRPATKYYVRAYAKISETYIYSNVISFTTNAVPPHQLVDCDNNLYDTVKIGAQIWMKSNLKTTRYNDGSEIPLVTDGTAWTSLNTPGYCWYNNNESTHKNTYGALYNWFSVHTGKLCPTGWHEPSEAEFTLLINYLGGTNLTGGKLKEIGTAHWINPNTDASNSTGFTALPAGKRNPAFEGMTSECKLWTNTQATENNVNGYMYSIYNSGANIFKDNWPKWVGASVRCIKD